MGGGHKTHWSAQDGEVVDISAADHVFTETTNQLYVGGTGIVVLVTVEGTTLTFTAVPVGTILDIRATQITKVGTDASLMVGLW